MDATVVRYPVIVTLESVRLRIFPHVGGTSAVPGLAIERSALAKPLRGGIIISAPISQSAWSAVCCAFHCCTSEPKTSEIDSFSAPELVMILETGGELRDAMCQLMANDTERLGEIRKI